MAVLEVAAGVDEAEDVAVVATMVDGFHGDVVGVAIVVDVEVAVEELDAAMINSTVTPISSGMRFLEHRKTRFSNCDDNKKKISVASVPLSLTVKIMRYQRLHNNKMQGTSLPLQTKKPKRIDARMIQAVL